MPRDPDVEYIDIGSNFLIGSAIGSEFHTLQIGVWRKTSNFRFKGAGRVRSRTATAKKTWRRLVTIDVGEYARKLEFGDHRSGKNWPFLEPAIRKNRHTWLLEFQGRFNKAVARRQRRKKSTLKEMLNPKADERTAKRILHNIGKLGVKAVQEQIWITFSPPLSAATIERKGHSKPLIDTGNLIQSIDYRIERDAPVAAAPSSERQVYGGTWIV